MAVEGAAPPDAPLQLVIVTPRGETFAGPIVRVVLPGSEGEFGVLRGHEAFVTALGGGRVEVLDPDGRTSRLTVSDGFARVTRECVVVLVGECRIEDEGPRPPDPDPGSPTP